MSVGLRSASFSSTCEKAGMMSEFDICGSRYVCIRCKMPLELVLMGNTDCFKHFVLWVMIVSQYHEIALVIFQSMIGAWNVYIS